MATISTKVTPKEICITFSGLHHIEDGDEIEPVVIRIIPYQDEDSLTFSFSIEADSNAFLQIGRPNEFDLILNDYAEPEEWVIE